MWSASRPNRLNPRNPLNIRLCRLQSQSECFVQGKNILMLSRIETLCAGYPSRSNIFISVARQPLGGLGRLIFRGFMITHIRHTTLGRTPLDE